MRKIITGLAVAGMLAGCITQQMEKSIGKSIDDVIVEFGNNYATTDLSDGRRLYEWTKTFEHQKPGSSTKTTVTKEERGRDGKPALVTTTNATSTRPEITTSTCRYVFITRQDPARRTWIVESIKSPGFGC